MKRQRRTFSAEFKREAAQLVIDQGWSVSEASRSLGVGEMVLRRWVQQLQGGKRSFYSVLPSLNIAR